jgi:hypothetical protein
LCWYVSELDQFNYISVGIATVYDITGLLRQRRAHKPHSRGFHPIMLFVEIPDLQANMRNSVIAHRSRGVSGLRYRRAELKEFKIALAKL